MTTAPKLYKRKHIGNQIAMMATIAIVVVSITSMLLLSFRYWSEEYNRCEQIAKLASAQAAL